MKKRLHFILSIALVFSLSLQAFAAGTLTNFTRDKAYTQGQFTDVAASAWYAEDVKAAYETGLVNGNTASTFGPDLNITVAETIVLSCRLHSIYNANGQEFVQGNPWYQVYIDYAVANGIISDASGDALASATRGYFADTLSKALTDEAFEAINSITAIPDVDSSSPYAQSVYKLYNAGILTGSDSVGSFMPESKIKRSEVAAILARMVDPTLRKSFSLGSDATGYDDIYQYASPVIDFTNDDGVMSALHARLRLHFEQELLPAKLFENKTQLADLIVNKSEDFLAFIDNEVWAIAKNDVVIDYMEQSDETYVIESTDDLNRYLTEFSEDYSLYAYQSYDCDAFKFDENTYCVLLNMADVYDSLKVDELDKLLLSTYIAIVYDDEADLFSYYLLERSLDGSHVLCRLTEDGSHNYQGVVENDKRAFVEGVLSAINS